MAIRGTKPYKQWYQSEQAKRRREQRKSAAANRENERLAAEVRALKIENAAMSLELNADPDSMRNMRARLSLAADILSAPETVLFD